LSIVRGLLKEMRLAKNDINDYFIDNIICDPFKQHPLPAELTINISKMCKDVQGKKTTKH
jgi:hypothetical protein